MPTARDYPKLRPVEAFPADQDGDQTFVVRDPSGLAEGGMTVSRAALFVLSLMDGQHNLEEIERIFGEQVGQRLPGDQLEQMVARLDASHYLDSPAFADYFASLVEDYRSSPARVSANEASLGAGDDGLASTIGRMLAACEVSLTGSRRLAGLIAPHLDFARGTPGYADAYGALAVGQAPQRVVILGTNHFGQTTGPVATRKDFQTPLGTTRADRAFIEALETRLGVDLCEHEFDHQREHSVELQVVILQQLLGADHFEMVPVLCHDPCGPTGAIPGEGRGADLRAFGEALGELILTDDTPTMIVAGADLSHVGRPFGDSRELDEAFLREVERKDRQALDALVAGGRDAFVETLRGHDNSTRVCSVGCIYALMTALPDAKPELLRYHQAVDRDTGTCVTCSAVAMWA